MIIPLTLLLSVRINVLLDFTCKTQVKKITKNLSMVKTEYQA